MSDVTDRLYEVADAYGLLAEHGEDKIHEAIVGGFERATEPLHEAWARAPKSPVGGLMSRRAENIEPEKIEWLWPGRLARGKHTCIAGEPGTGKSQVAIAIIAAVTGAGGEWPCDEGQAPRGSVLVLSAEDGAADTIVPRLMAAGADLSPECISSLPFAVLTAKVNAFSICKPTLNCWNAKLLR